MTNASDLTPDVEDLEPVDSTIELDPDFDLADELAATTGWEDEDDPEDVPTVGAMELAERHALRRVAGLSTELEDISEVEYRQLRLERVVLVGVWTDGSVEDAENSMAELALLAETAGSEVLEAIYQRRQSPDPATYVGRGKVDAHPRDRAGDRRRHRDLRRRAGAEPAAQPGGPAQGQGRRPDRADPRHLRPAREVQGGPGAGRAGAAQLHEAAAARLGRQPLPPGRRPGRRGRRRHRRPRPR